MLRIITGLAGAGKTAKIMEEIRADVAAKLGGRVLLVPEQYSHEAERELAGVAGPSMALYAEVLSFTGVARRVEAELGPGSRRALTAGGRLLCMALALESVFTQLHVYGPARRSGEAQMQLLSALDELAAAEVTPDALMDAAEHSGGVLGGKLHDLALISAAFSAAVGSERTDAADRLTLLADRLEYSGFARNGSVYIDGFTDFTAQEKRIVRTLIRRADVTICLTLDSVEHGSELFDLARGTARSLMRFARDEGIECRCEALEAPARSPMDTLAGNLLAYPGRHFDAGGRISLRAAAQLTDECDFAAATALRLARSGCRWRDIAIAVRGFEDYRPALTAAFERFGVPLFTATRPDVSQKPLPTLISSAYEIITGGWEQGDVFAYLRTGLAGLDGGECDELENYCFTWSIDARRWHSARDWGMHPDGYGGEYDDAARSRLERINALRRRAAAPLLAFESAARAASDARGQCEALSALFEDLDLAGSLARRADELESSGRRQAAAEYARIWDAAVDALEQCSAVLGGMGLDAAAFARLYLLTLSQYGVGVIPVSLDMVTAGDMDRMRRRHIKHLIILGASDDRLPAPESEGGVFTGEERRALAQLGLELDAGEAELWREYTLIYNCVSLPGETLTICRSTWGADGQELSASFLMERAKGLFGLEVVPVDRAGCLLESENTAIELAAATLAGETSPAAAAARSYYAAAEPERLAEIESAARITRGRLSRESARSLYGDNLRLSASRLERFSSCRFSYFMTYGLKAKPRERARFRAPEVGSFVHYVLQHVAADAPEGGLAAMTDERIGELTRAYTGSYIDEKLGGREGKSARFMYLYERLAAGVERIVRDMAAELRDSDFVPLDFELDLSRAVPGAALEVPGGGSVRAVGVADRVDGWVHDGRLYLRVVDYKTGRKSFSLSDVYYGLGMQMLLYLFTLAGAGQERYGLETVPAGVLYIPARDDIISAESDMDDAEIAKKRREGLVRSGLLLADTEVLRAMEHEGAGPRLPVKWKDGVPTGDSLAGTEQLGALARHVEDTLKAIASELRSGSIEADPCYKSARDNACLWCDYASACRFADGEDGDGRRYLPTLKATRVWEMLEGDGDNA